jgi:hypothetical protein
MYERFLDHREDFSRRYATRTHFRAPFRGLKPHGYRQITATRSPRT